ncbi:hypothetical protein ANCDUO_15209 [Ancylostoma duodenale]|uniref:Uncharacterized protein n=1 Tax=Ancylostoma duodenale TaxID=51022 RepID=A0A0C2CE92_9BILA|nr:hypothetical protein ANCDUO_15209 [Ancylostoma duodenale]
MESVADALGGVFRILVWIELEKVQQWQHSPFSLGGVACKGTATPSSRSGVARNGTATPLS